MISRTEEKLLDFHNVIIEEKYPLLEINLKKIYENAKNVIDLCSYRGINVSGVFKGCNGAYQVAKEFLSAGCKHIASSRIEQLMDLKLKGLDCETMLIRIPMPCEIEDIVKYVDISLVSEIKTLDLLEYFSHVHNKQHNVVLMYDLGDLREGFINRERFIDTALYVERKLSNVNLLGIGTNLGCYGSIKPTKENLGYLCELAEEIEEKISRKLDIISGGGTTTLPLIIDDEIPEKINNLRIGEGILLARDLEDLWGYDMSFMHLDTFTLKAQIVEIKTKPSYPIGEIFIDAFGNLPIYEDRGERKRAILAVGKQDFGSHDKLIPKEKGIDIVGSSSDHLIVDIEDYPKKLSVGDILEFHLYYPAMLYLSNSNYVNKVFI